MVVVAISGMPGCGSTTVGSLLAKKLKVDFFSLGNYTKIEALKIVDQPEETQRAAEFWYSEKGSSADFHNQSDKLQRDVAKKGNVVVDSKLGVHMLRGIADFRVWLKSPFDSRAGHVAKRDKIANDDAQDILEEKERLERENFMRIYKIDYFDQEKEADMVIDVYDKKPDKIVKMIMDEMKSRGILKK